MSSTDTTPPAQRLAVSVREAAALFSLGKDTLYNAIKAGELRTSKVGARRLVMVDDMRDWIRSKAA